MYKIAIVDDEVKVKRGLSEKVIWNELNCTVCATASNGIEGIELLQRYKPDIVITDIKMPGMNGLELAEYAKLNYPNTVTILLSGYSEFDYARMAVRNQVFDYLLKPIDIPDLKVCILNAIDKINSTRDSARNAVRDLKGESTGMLESGILMNLIVNGNKDIETLRKKMNELGIALATGQIIIFEIYDTSHPLYEKYASLYQYAVNNIVYETYRNCKIDATTIIDIEGKSVVVVKFNRGIQQDIMVKRVVEATTVCQENISTYLKKQITVGIGVVFRDIGEVNDSFRNALKMLDINIFWGIRKPQFQDNQIEFVASDVGTQINPQLFDAVNENDCIKLDQYFNKFIYDIKSHKNKSTALNCCIDFLLGLSKYAPNEEVKEQITQSITEITRLRTFEEYTALMNRMMVMVGQEAKLKKEQAKGKSLMERILDYIDQHYHELNLNLQYVAAVFHVSASHLSRLFKKEIGINFNEYLSKKRVEKAKILLSEDQRLSVLDIAHQVGFADGKYFGQVFKKYYGITPSNFK